MSTLKTKYINSLRSYTKFVEELTDTRWYRGCNECYELTPSLYRHPTKTESAALLKQEIDIIKRFRQRSTPYLPNPTATDKDLNTLFLMQHFGVPTRLLDWSENPYIALYFALNDVSFSTTSGIRTYNANVCVWVLDPAAWNNKSLDFDPPPGIIYSLDDALLNGYLPTDNPLSRKPDPVALYGIYNNPRIVIQRGVFTLFGSSVKPMEKTYVDNNYPQDCLLRLIIRKQYIPGMLDSLPRIGVTDSSVFPDLEGLAKELKRHFGYQV